MKKLILLIPLWGLAVSLGADDTGPAAPLLSHDGLGEDGGFAARKCL